MREKQSATGWQENPKLTKVISLAGSVRRAFDFGREGRRFAPLSKHGVRVAAFPLHW